MIRRITVFIMAAVATMLLGRIDGAAAPVTAALSLQGLVVDGKAAACELYAINGANYMRLSDLASGLNGSGSQFSANWDAALNTVYITTGKACAEDGSEPAAPNTGSLAVAFSPVIRIDGNTVTGLTVYIIGGHYFFKVRELGDALGFSVDYEAASNSVIVKSMATVTVSTAVQLLNAIAPNTRVVLSAGTYNLSSVNISAVKNHYVSWRTVFDGTEIVVSGVKGCTISGAARAGSTSVVVEPRYANVLSFSGCASITVENLTVGHTKESGYCTGGVLHFSDSQNARISSCVLYGCGTYGLMLEKVRGLTVRDTEIKECTYGIMTADSSSSLSFINSSFHDCIGYTMMTLYNCNAVSFDGCAIKNNISDTSYDSLIFLSVCDTVTFHSCTISGNATDSMIKAYNCAEISFKDNSIQSNTFTTGVYAKGSDKGIVFSPEL